MPKKKGCRISQWNDANFDYGEYDSTAPTDIVKKINDAHARWEVFSKLGKSHPAKNLSDEMNVKFWTRMEQVGKIVELGRYNPNMRKAVENRSLGILAKLRGTDLKSLTEKQLVQFSRRATGYVSDVLSQLETAKYADNLYKKIQTILPDNLNTHQKYELMWDAIELGSQPYLANTVPELSEPAIKWLQIRKDNFIKKMDSYGVNERAQTQLVEAAKLLVQANQEIPALVSNIGLDIGVLNNMGYLERIFTKEASEIMSIVESGGMFNRSLDKLDSSKATESFQKSRKFNDFIVEDVDVLQYLFDKSKVFDRLNKRLDNDPKLKASINIPEGEKVTSITQLLSPGNEPIFLHALINELSEDELKFLTESGFMSKIPWETSRANEWMIKNFKFPFEGINDVYQSDPRKAVSIYSKQLESLAAQSSKVWGTINGAISEGWGVTRKEITDNPEVYRGYVPLREAYPNNILENALGGGKSKDMEHFLDETFVHPIVAKTINADLTITSSPFLMSLVGQTLQIFKKWGTGLMLGTPAWFGRQVIGWTGTVLANGAPPQRFLQHLSIWSYAKANQLLKGESVLDYAKYLNNTNLIYAGGTMTEAQLWRHAVKKGLINDFNIFGDNPKVNERSLKRTINEYKWYLKNYEPDYNQQLGLAVKAANDLTDESPLFQFLSWGNVITDNMGRFTMLEAALRDRPKFTVSAFPSFANPDEAVEYVFKNTWNFDDIPKDSIGKNQVVQSLVPFINWRLKNFQQATVFATEHPHRFASYLYLTGRPSEDAKEDYPMEWSTINDGWVDKFDRPMVWEVPEELSGTGRKEYYTYPLTTLVPLMDPLGDIIDITRVFGAFNGDEPLHRRGDVPKEMISKYEERATKLRRLIKEETMPWVELAIGQINQQDNWGTSFDELREKNKKRQLLGIPIDPVLYWSITTAAPVLKYPDRVLSYTGALGSAPYLDPKSGEYKEGTPNYLGITPDYQTSAQKPKMMSPTLSMLGDALGFAPYNHDVWWAQGYTTDKVRGLVTNGNKWLKTALIKIGTAPNEESQNTIRKKIHEVATFTFWAEVELAYLEKWRTEQNLPTQRALKIIEAQNRKLDNLLTEEDKQVIRERIWEKYKGYMK